MTLPHDDLGEGPVVVLLHPSGFGPALVRPFAEQLSCNHRVVIPHRAGFGESAKLSPPGGLADIHDDLARLIDALALSDPVVVGISAGATLALGFELRHSGVAAAVIAHEPLVGPLGGSLHTRIKGRIARLLDRATVPHETSLFISEVVGISTWNSLRADWREAVEDHGIATRHEASLFRTFALDEDDLLTLAARPVLVTVGEQSPGPRHALSYAVALRGIRTMIIPGSGHLPCVEAAGAYAAVVDSLIPSLGGTP